MPRLFPVIAVLLVALISAAPVSAEVSGATEGNIVRKYHFNADTGVTVKDDGTVVTGTAQSAPGSLKAALQTETMWAETDETMTDQKLPQPAEPSQSADGVGAITLQAK